MHNWLLIFVGVALFAATPAIAQRPSPPITALAISPGGEQVIVGSQAGVRIYAWPELKEEGALATELVHVHDLAFSPQGDRLLAAGGAPEEAGVVEMWSWAEKERIASEKLHRDVIYKARWATSGNQIVTASADGETQIVEAKSLKAVGKYAGHSRALLDALWLDDGTLALSAGVDQTIQCWEAASRERRRSLSNHVGTVNALAMRPKQEEGPPVLASISEDRTLRVWQPTMGRLMRFVRLPSPPRAVCWSADGATIYVGCNDGVIRAATFDELAIAREINGGVGRIHEIALHPNATSIVAAGERGVRAIFLDEVK